MEASSDSHPNTTETPLDDDVDGEGEDVLPPPPTENSAPSIWRQRHVERLLHNASPPPVEQPIEIDHVVDDDDGGDIDQSECDGKETIVEDGKDVHGDEKDRRGEDNDTLGDDACKLVDGDDPSFVEEGPDAADVSLDPQAKTDVEQPQSKLEYLSDRPEEVLARFDTLSLHDKTRLSRHFLRQVEINANHCGESLTDLVAELHSAMHNVTGYSAQHISSAKLTAEGVEARVGECVESMSTFFKVMDELSEAMLPVEALYARTKELRKVLDTLEVLIDRLIKST